MNVSDYKFDFSCKNCNQPPEKRTSLACVLLRYGGSHAGSKERTWHSFIKCAEILGISLARVK